MNATNHPNRSPSRKLCFPRWLTPIYFVVLIPLALILTPWACSLLSPHYRWNMGRPSVWQFFGLMPIAAGSVCIIWIIVLHYKEASEARNDM